MMPRPSGSPTRGANVMTETFACAGGRNASEFLGQQHTSNSVLLESGLIANRNPRQGPHRGM